MDAREVLRRPLRGVNVGRANRIAMADLASMMERLGFGNVRTLLANSSGNLVFTVPQGSRARPGPRIESCLLEQFGRPSHTGDLLPPALPEFSKVIEENPFGATATDPARLLVAVFADPAQLTLLAPIRAKKWGSGQLSCRWSACCLPVVPARTCEPLGGNPARKELSRDRNFAKLVHPAQTPGDGGGGEVLTPGANMPPHRFVPLKGVCRYPLGSAAPRGSPPLCGLRDSLGETVRGRGDADRGGGSNAQQAVRYVLHLVPRLYDDAGLDGGKRTPRRSEPTSFDSRRQRRRVGSSWPARRMSLRPRRSAW